MMNNLSNNPAPSFTLEDETELFLKTAGGGQPEHAFCTYRSGLAYFFDYAQYDRIKEELAQATNVKAKSIAQKIPAPESAAGLELVSLRREDLDDARQGAWVTGKGRKTRFVAFDDEIWGRSRPTWPSDTMKL